MKRSPGLLFALLIMSSSAIKILNSQISLVIADPGFAFQHLRAFKGTDEIKQNFNLVFERSVITYHNPKYVSDVETYVKRYNRTSPSIFNFKIIIKDPWGVNVTIQLTTFEFRDNQYKESIIKTNEHICHLIEKDKIITEVLRRYSNLPEKCPAVGLFEIVDYKIEDGSFLAQVPPSKWRFNINLVQNINKEYILKFEAYIRILKLSPKKRIKSNK